MLGIEARALPLRAGARLRPAGGGRRGADRRGGARHRSGHAQLTPTGATYPPEGRSPPSPISHASLDCGSCSTRPTATSSPRAPARRTRSSPTTAGGSNVIELYSFSKSYAVPGHRLGALIAGTPVIEEVAKILDNTADLPRPRRPGGRRLGGRGVARLAHGGPRHAGGACPPLLDAVGASAGLGDLFDRAVFRLSAPSVRGRSRRPRVARRLAAERGVHDTPGELLRAGPGRTPEGGVRQCRGGAPGGSGGAAGRLGPGFVSCGPRGTCG